MRRNLQILFTCALIFTVNVALATTGSSKKTDGQEQEQEGRRKADQSMMRPDGESATVPVNQQDYQVQEEDKNGSPERGSTSAGQAIEKIDTLQDDSVSKYNFIFYFLYKFKYDAEEAP